MKSIFKTYRQNIGTYFHNLEAYPQKIGGYLVLLFIIHFFTVEPAVAQKSFLQSQGTATQLIVDGKPFLILGGELGNSSASSVQDIERIFPKLQRMGLNTKGVFPSDTTLEKLVYLAYRNIRKKWTMPLANWATISQQLAIKFGERFKLL